MEEKYGKLANYVLEGEIEKIEEHLENFPEDIDKKAHYGETPLILACSSKLKNVDDSLRERIVKLLVEKGANVNARTNDGYTALHQAILDLGDFIRYHIMEILLENGADVNLQEEHDFTPMHLLVVRGTYDEINLLLEHGADIEIQNKFEQNVIENLDDEVEERGRQTRILLNRIHLAEYRIMKKIGELEKKIEKN